MIEAVKDSHLNFELIQEGNPRLDELREFAKTFNHEIEQHPYPIFAVKKNGQFIAYVQVAMAPLAFPAIHTDPNICRPRDTVEIMKAFTYWTKIQHGGNGFLTAPTDSTTFTPAILERLGFIRLHKEVYAVNNT